MTDYAVLAVIVVVGLFGVGTLLIDTYFKRKAQFVDDLYDKTKGNTDAKSE